MKIKFKTLLLFVLAFSSILLQSQTDVAKYEVKGKIIDEATKEPLIGAFVIYQKGKGVTTDLNGEFALNLIDGEYDLTIGLVGFAQFSQKIIVAGKSQTIGPVSLSSVGGLEEVMIIADIARSRETPIAFSDITGEQIVREVGGNDMTMLVNSTPGAYATQRGGGAGDSRVNIRGFDQRYIGVLVDGVPVNDMENGAVYWSNWAGLAEVTQKTQVQRGLGASRLALPAVGGVMNIITNPIDQQKSLVVSNNNGTANYHRLSIAYNSGILKNKIGYTLSGSYTEGDGFVDQTWQKTWSYFAKVSYKINSNSMLILSINGAPQSHGQRSFAINMAYHDRKYAEEQGVNVDSVYASLKYTSANIGARGTTYSPDWGYVNGKAKAVKTNYFHKPLLNLSYFLNINSRLSFSNVLYASFGKGGGTSLNSFPTDIYDATGTGQLLLQNLYDGNVSTPAGTVVPGQAPASYYLYASINNHKWVGTLSTLKFKINSSLNFLGGLDARYYNGSHYQTPHDLLGGNYVMAPAGKDLNLAPRGIDPKGYVKYVGDKISYHNDSKVSWLGLFGQVEYKFKKLTSFLTITGNQSGFQYINYFGKRDIELSKDNIVHNAVGYGDTLYYDGQNYGVPQLGSLTKNVDGSVSFYDKLTKSQVTILNGYNTFNNTSSQSRISTSEFKYFKGYTAKGGLNYDLNANNNVFLNSGYMSLVPKFNNVYDNNGNTINTRNQIITSAEIGYGLRYKRLAANLNGYLTSWENKPADFISAFTPTAGPYKGVSVNYNPTGIDAILKGVEFDLTYRPFKFIEIKAFGMMADWKWNSKGITYAYANDATVIDTIEFDAKGIAIGNSPQRQLGGSVKYELVKNIYVKVQYTYFDKMYAQFDPSNLKVAGDGPTAPDYRGYSSWEAPGYGVFDLFAGYNIYSGNSKVDIMASMNNALNKVYMTDVFFPSSVTPNNYNATNTVGWFGLGRRFNIGIKVTL